MIDLRGKANYAWRELAANYDDPVWWRGRLYDRVVHPIHASVYPGYDDAIQVMNEDWDTLLVLDACRADLFVERVPPDEFDAYETAVSAGSSSPEWTHRNFVGGEFGDTVYVSANPWISRLAGGSFHELVEVWRTAFDEDLGTVPAEAVTEAVRSVAADYPNKRIVAHYMQPHHPFVPSDLDSISWDVDGVVEGNVGQREGTGVWGALREGTLDRSTAWEAYGDNLDYVMDHVRPLVEEIDGRTVITSDHGNLLGERVWPLPIRGYGHPAGLRLRPLVEVPWAVVDGPRREIADDGVRASGVEGGSEELEQRLRALGYAE